tara:strand:+ start:1804 stop:2790 length:987 start_codon:yes stop_codon:yes gene_type:complete
MRELIVEKIMSDNDVDKLKGTWINEDILTHPIITEDTDVYYYDDDNIKQVLLKFRKNMIDDKYIKIGWESYKNLAKPSRGRGASAGPINVSGVYWSKKQLADTDKWRTSYILKNGKKSKMKVNNQVFSNPVGFFESDNKMYNLPCRLTHFTRQHYDDYLSGIPYIEKIDECFKTLMPERYKSQYDRATKKPDFKISDTSFSTVTINRNFRTAAHKDAGDYEEGFGNLTVIERGKYHGGYTCFPQFGIGVDVRTNDYLAMDVHQYHANTEMYETDEDILFNSKLDSAFKDNVSIGTEGIDKKYTRLTFVCYLRTKLINCDIIDPDLLKK